MASVLSPFGVTLRIRMLLDPGSELSLVSEQVVQYLHLARHKSSIPLTGVGRSTFGTTRGAVTLMLQSIHSDRQLPILAHILHHLTSTLPSFSPDRQSWAHIEGLQLADPAFCKPGPIDLIIGADAYGLMIEPDLRKGASSEPIAQRTIFGWVIFGPVVTSSSASAHVLHATVNQANLGLRELLCQFWVQEEIPQAAHAQLTPAEAECEAHFLATHSRDPSGRYTVRLPFSDSSERLGDSRTTAQQCLDRTLRRLSRDATYGKLYTAFMREYEELNHMRSVSPYLQSGSPVYYLPHHGVLREDSQTTKLRVVFNGSSSSTTGCSLNDILHTGAKLQLDISDVLLWVRRHKYIFATDITKMFRQIRVHGDDWKFQRILWVDDHGQPVTYALTTVTYGTRSAPFLAARTIRQLVNDEGKKFPLAVQPLTRGCYVDDIYGGADTLDELCSISQQLIGICSSGGFPLAKWLSNSPTLLREVSTDGMADAAHSFGDDGSKILGLAWEPTSDQFKFNTRITLNSKFTKRTILSEVSQLYDPLGFLSPVVVRAKILLQELWLNRRGWDDPLSPPLTHRWQAFREELGHLSALSIPRWLNLFTAASVEIHGFSDASQLAMAAVVYLRVLNHSSEPTVTLVCAKTKVAPLKRLTIPRLELSAAVLLARLVRYVQLTAELVDAPTYLWTDSAVTLTWISSHPSRWKEYVQNRVAMIQDLLPTAQWRFIPGKENPADCASRGLTVSQLTTHSLWWRGPPWLAHDSSRWPVLCPPTSHAAVLEERPGLILYVDTPSLPPLWGQFSRYSSLQDLLRITTVCFRASSAFRGNTLTGINVPLAPHELEHARTYWVRAFQIAWFAKDMLLIANGTALSRTHPLNGLTPFVDRHGTLRVGGRLNRSDLEPEEKHPAILPRDSPLTQLIIAAAHKRTLHGGTQLTLAELRRRYWIVGGRAPVRSFILRCVTCARQRGIRAQQLMGQLPPARLTPSRPFLNTGVDYAGPISIKAWRGRGSKCHKGWLAIFVCFSTSAVHLEAVEDYSTDGFIATYRRFTARRGICQTLYSDCGTNFLGADAALKRLFSSGSTELGELSRLLANDGTRWSFNPPAAPHFGGKWEAAVKSAKYHLRRTIGDTVLTFGELSTLLAQIEAVLNSRPLSPLSDDVDDLTALTPGHFLVGHALTTIPEPSLTEVPQARLNRWQLIQQRLQCFWTRWSTECLQRYLSTSKWHHPSNQIKVGSLVLLTDERFPPSKWPLARVLALHPGADGLTRVVTIKTATSTLTRPIVKLAILPVDGALTT